MFSKIILTALAFVAATSGTPLTPPTITVCTGSLSPPEGCVTIPIVDGGCTTFDEGLSFLNKEVSSVGVPGGDVCTFYEDAGCISTLSSGADTVVLQGGSWDMFEVPGVAGTVNFNDLASSFTCSPV